MQAYSQQMWPYTASSHQQAAMYAGYPGMYGTFGDDSNSYWGNWGSGGAIVPAF